MLHVPFVLVLGLVLVLGCLVWGQMGAGEFGQPGGEHVSGTSYAFQIEHEHEHERRCARFIETVR